jgi:hypothetical protein
LNHYFYALTAHFGHWVVGVGKQARQWQVTTGLIYGQVKKTYRHWKLVRVTPVMRCGTLAALRAGLTGLGLSGELNTAFVERLKKDITAERGRTRAADVVHRTGSAAVAVASGVVACLVSLCPATHIVT